MDKTAGKSSTWELQNDNPTVLPLSEVASWVVWQFPRPRRGGLCAALHPPEAKYGWLPAVVYLDEGRVEIFAHSAGPFPTPEEAAKWMERA
jgi:hypothetical protein